MRIEPGTLVGVSVTRGWCQAAERFLLQYGYPNLEAERYLLLAHVVDGDDPKGLWVKYRENDQTPTYLMLIPWNHICTVVQAEEFSDGVRKEAKKIGFAAP